MSILQHPEWATLQWCLCLEFYNRDHGKVNPQPRHRIEVRRKLPPDLVAHLLTLTTECVHCGRTMHPIRDRAHKGGLYFAATCEDALHGSCSKGKAASAEYTRIKAALRERGGQPPPTVEQERLF